MSTIGDTRLGSRIRLVEMTGDPNPVEPGTEGTVERIMHVSTRPAFTQVWVAWDDGRTLALVVPPDTFEVIGDPKD